MTDVTALVAELRAAQEWMRRPDWADEFTLRDIVEWLNERPVSIMGRAADAIESPTPPAAGEAEEITIRLEKGISSDDNRRLLKASMREAATLIRSQAARVAELEAERDRPETEDFLKGVPLEAAHQRERFGSDHDAGKTPFDWFWLIGYLAQKAADAAVREDVEKAKHHTISTAAALANWHLALSGADTRMRPGIDPVARGLEPPTQPGSGEEA